MKHVRPLMVWDSGFWDYNSFMSQPFNHDELPLKQQFVELARAFHDKSNKSVENQLASALLYMNLADYLAEHLVLGLHEMSSEAMDKYYLGIVSVLPQQKDSFSIGNSIYALKGYDFPKKEKIMLELEAVNKARKKIAHEIIKTKSDELPEVDKAYNSLVEHTEKLVVLVDSIYVGMPPQNLIEKLQELDNENSQEEKKKEKNEKK